MRRFSSVIHMRLAGLHSFTLVQWPTVFTGPSLFPDTKRLWWNNSQYYLFLSARKLSETYQKVHWKSKHSANKINITRSYLEKNITFAQRWFDSWVSTEALLPQLPKIVTTSCRNKPTEQTNLIAAFVRLISKPKGATATQLLGDHWVKATSIRRVSISVVRSRK